MIFNNRRLRRLTVLMLFLTASARLAAQQPDDGIPITSVPENSPCPDQPKSLKELTVAFGGGRVPSPSEMTGSWVAISIFIGRDESTMDCSGLRRGKKLFEEVMVANGYSLEMHVVGVGEQKATMRRNSTRSLSFPFSFGGDAAPVLRCRLTKRNTLACLIDVYRQAVEFKRISVQPDEIARNP